MTAFHYFLIRKAVSVSIWVIPTNPTIIAVVSAIIGKFNKSPNKHIIAIMLLPHRQSPLLKVISLISGKKILKLLKSNILFCLNFIYDRNKTTPSN